MIPDYEETSCKEIFSNPTCHEACFGLARLYCYEGKFQRALEFLNLALTYKTDLLYKKWQSILTVKVTKQVDTEAIQTKSVLSTFLCCNPVHSQISVLNLLQEHPECVESLWGYMELSMKGFPELDHPEHYASKIKDQNPYLGYLSWSEVYFRRNEWQKGLDILKQLIINFSNRPEAYIKLFYHYFYNVQDYEQAEGVLLEASLMVNSSEHHQYYILFSIYSAKALFKLKRIRESLDLLQRKFLENPTYPIFLYMYGKYCTKSEDYIYNGTAIGALQECIRLCDSSRYGLIYYWLAKAHTQARQHIEAYDIVKLALQYLDSSSSSKKVLELRRWMFDMQGSIQKIEEIQRILAEDLNSEGFKKCKELCAEVKDLHKLTVDVLYAEMLWKTGRHEEALKKLYAVSGISTVKMNAHFLLLKYLGKQKNMKCMKTVACEMVVKCKNPQVPANVWVKANLIYAKVLIKNKKPGKAIMILKLLAKVLPPIPFANITYTKLLRRAKNLQDLTLAHSLTLDSYNTYNYGTYKNSFIDGAFEVRDFSQRFIAEEAAPLPSIMDNRFRERRADRTVSEKVNEFRIYKKKKTQDEFEIENEEKKDNTLLGVQIPPREFKSLTVCSDPSFLYKIGKIAAAHRVSVQDGICAINDFIELLKFEKDRFKRLEMLEKAEKVRSKLYHIIKD